MCGIACEVEGISRKNSKQFGLLPVNTLWEIFENPSMLIPTNPTSLELLMSTSEMVTLIVLRKYRVILDHFVNANSEEMCAPQKAKLSFTMFSVLTFVNANPNGPVQRMLV